MCTCSTGCELHMYVHVHVNVAGGVWGIGDSDFCMYVRNWNVYSHRIRIDVCIHVYVTCIYTGYCVTQYLRYVGDWDSVRVCNWNVYSHRIRVDVCIHVYVHDVYTVCIHYTLCYAVFTICGGLGFGCLWNVH